MSKAKEKYENLVRQMEWYTITFSFQGQKPESFNIFHSYKFSRGVVDILSSRKRLTYAEFRDAIRKECMYSFWSKCEYEIVVGPWPSFRIREVQFYGSHLNVKPEYYSKSKEDICFTLTNQEAAKENKMIPGKYYLQAVDDCRDTKIDVFRQLEPNLDRLTEYIIKSANYRVAKEEKEAEKEAQ